MTFEEWFMFSNWEEQPVGTSRTIAWDAWHAATAQRDAEVARLRKEWWADFNEITLRITDAKIESARLRGALGAVGSAMIVMEAVLRGYKQLPRLTEEAQRLKQIIEAALSTADERKGDNG